MTDLKSCRVLVTPTSYGKNDARLCTELEAAVGKVAYNPTGHPLSAAELAELLPGCHGYIAGLDHNDHTALEAADQLKVLARYGAGIDRVDLNAAKVKGITVTNTPGTNAVSVTELTIGLMLSLARMLPDANEATKAGHWPRLSGTSIEGRVVGLLGLGAIGKQVAKRLQGFDCKIVAVDPIPDVDLAKAYNRVYAQ